MLRPTGTLGIGMTEMPRLARLDVAADELTVYELGALAGGTSSTTHPAASHDRRPPLPGSAVRRSRVLRLLASAPESSALRRAEPLVVRDGQELTRAAIAVALPVCARHPEPHLRRTTRPAGPADRLVPVARVELERTAATGLSHDGSPKKFQRSNDWVVHCFPALLGRAGSRLPPQ